MNRLNLAFFIQCLDTKLNSMKNICFAYSLTIHTANYLAFWYRESKYFFKFLLNDPIEEMLLIS